MAKVKVAINGFGRIGRLFLRAGADDVEVVGINDLTTAEVSAHLLKYDSSHRTWGRSVQQADGKIIVDDKPIRYTQIKDPAELPWRELGVDIVLECTGKFVTKEAAEAHLKAGAKKVIVSAPAKGADLTVVYGINHEKYDAKNHAVLSNASCTTNCLAPIAKVLNDTFSIQYGLMTTVHSYTNDQVILDAPHKDLRRARAAATSMIPTTTGAAKAVGEVLPELKGRLNGIAVRVPTANVSLVDLVVQTKKEVTVESINAALKEAAAGSLKGILHCENAPLVSADYIGSEYSSTVDLPSTMVMGPNLAKVFSWYDNEYGFARRMVDLAAYMGGKF
jgi:glyceraldehyde 3-phosphate dehydrogenase